MARKRIDQLLVDRGVFDSRAKARAAIEAGRVSVAGRVVAKPSEQVDDNAEVAAEAAHPWVGRGALKLVHALDTWPIAVEGRVAIDVGASTGGFTEVLLSREAAFVFAVDVGRDQLHPNLKANNKITNLSKINTRNLNNDRIAQPPNLIINNISFISLTKALPATLHLATQSTELITLIKPQFKAGHEHISKNRLVKNPNIITHIKQEIVTFLETTN